MVVLTLLDESQLPKRAGRRKGGADPDQAPVVQTVEIDEPGVTLSADAAKVKAPLRKLVMEGIIQGVQAMSTSLSNALKSDTAQNLAILGVVVASSAGALQIADDFYGKDVCSPAMTQLAESMASFGMTGSRDKCAVSIQAYKDTFALLKPLVYTAVSAATSRVIGVKINIGDGFLAKAMNMMISRLQATPDTPEAPADAAPSTGKSARGSKPAAPAATGGRTKRRGSKKGRKGGKSRKHRR